jgi:hypothetical protein
MYVGPRVMCYVTFLSNKTRSNLVDRHGKANCPATQILSKDAKRSQIGFTRKRLGAQLLHKSERNPCLAERLIAFVRVLTWLTQNISNASRRNRLVRTGIRGTSLKFQTEFSVNSHPIFCKFFHSSTVSQVHYRYSDYLTKKKID